MDTWAGFLSAMCSITESGAYTASLFLVHVSPNPFGAIAAGIAVGAVVATVIGFSANRGRSFCLGEFGFQSDRLLACRIRVAEFNPRRGWPAQQCGRHRLSGFQRQAHGLSLRAHLQVPPFLLPKIFTLSPYGVLVRSMKENEDRVQFLAMTPSAINGSLLF